MRLSRARPSTLALKPVFILPLKRALKVGLRWLVYFSYSVSLGGFISCAGASSARRLFPCGAPAETIITTRGRTAVATSSMPILRYASRWLCGSCPHGPRAPLRIFSLRRLPNGCNPDWRPDHGSLEYLHIFHGSCFVTSA